VHFHFLTTQHVVFLNLKELKQNLTLKKIKLLELIDYYCFNMFEDLANFLQIIILMTKKKYFILLF